MAKHKETGRVVHIEPIATGINRAGREWRRLDIVIDISPDERYPNPLQISYWNEKAGMDIREGDIAECEFYLRGSEFNGRHKVQLSGASIDFKSKVPRNGQATPQASAPVAPSAQSVPPSDLSADDDSLPF